METFGQYLKNIRLSQNITLRRFCLENGYDPSFVSKVERGILPPPKDDAILKRYAKALNLKENSDKWYEFIDRAEIENGSIPHDLAEEKELIGKLPLLFRTIRGGKTPRDKLKILLNIVKSA